MGGIWKQNAHLKGRDNNQATLPLLYQPHTSLHPPNGTALPAPSPHGTARNLAFGSVSPQANVLESAPRLSSHLLARPSPLSVQDTWLKGGEGWPTFARAVRWGKGDIRAADSLGRKTRGWEGTTAAPGPAQIQTHVWQHTYTRAVKGQSFLSLSFNET